MIFSEAGDGEGVPDGMEAVCKRMTDRMLALGRDISDVRVEGKLSKHS